ncbi:MAG: DUF3800 domain-containing protein [Actinomycetes bacterium]
MSAKARRDFIFIDEHGDPGPAATGSTHFASIAIHTTDVSLAPLVECFADLRFYRQIYKETKSLDSIPTLRPKLAEIFRHMATAHAIHFSVTHIDKRTYAGPYMDPVDGVRFRNFQVRCLLEWHFARHPVASTECEIVFDRHSHSHSQLDDLRRYLGGSGQLPKFAAVTAVDSRYVESIQVADLALRIWRRRRLDKDPRYATLDLGFMGECSLTGKARGWPPQLNP